MITKSPDDKIKNFLDGLMLMDPEKYDLIIKLRDLIIKSYPEAAEKMMYGGIIFSYKGDMFSGIFSYKKHVSMEFSNGFQMNDPEKNLEGGGKFRRHLKFISNEDIGNKNVEFYIAQAI